MRFLTTLFALFSSISLLGCGASADSQDSTGSWAHIASKQSMATINSRIQYLDLQFKTDFDKVSVCVQGSQSYAGSALLLETKLAYAAWLSASGQGNSRTWNHLEFELKSSCNMRDKNYSSVVVISEEYRITDDQQIDKTFAKNQVRCQRVGYDASCSTESMTLGLGGPGLMNYRSNTYETWDSLSNYSPATVLLSPFVEWTSMEGELNTSALRNGYASLKTKAGSVTYSELVNFNKLLETAQVKNSDDDRLDGVVQSFLSSNKSSLTQIWVPISPGYHVLLHEVGHQFGMNHADDPKTDSETGSSPGSSKDMMGKWTTELSTMAYADEYLYLTADDRAGILDLATKSAAFVKAHRSQ
ncbi:MAG: hypothetical protein EOP10_10285 [Proteobacteria bacterium]|nr:MAG: hypothetical protein EOP10_10285 [Pseudomonadota bacterium]